MKYEKFVQSKQRILRPCHHQYRFGVFAVNETKCSSIDQIKLAEDGL